MLKNQRVAVLVDVQNMFYSARQIHRMKLNYDKLLKYCVGQRQLIRAICYVVVTEVEEQVNFITALEEMGFEVKLKKLKIMAGGNAKGNWDIGIAIDAVSISDKVDVVILASGDGDFVDLVHLLKSKGVKVEAAAFPKSTSEDLIAVVDEFKAIDEKFLMPLNR